MGVAIITGLWIGLETRADEQVGTNRIHYSWPPCDVRADSDIINRISCGDWKMDLNVPAIPTFTALSVATPTPAMESVVLRTQTPKPVSLRDGDSGSFDRLLDRVFGADSTKAFKVADCEMGYKLSAGGDAYTLNRSAVGAEGEVSLWQIHPIHFWKYDPYLLQTNLEYAAQAAWELSGNGAAWTIPWRYCGWQ